MTQFYAVTQQEMEAFLLPQGFQKMNIPNTVELVYGKVFRRPGKEPVTLRILTGINPDGRSRAKGKDAIRVMIFIKYDNEAFSIGKAQTVRRIETWQKNLQNAIDRWATELADCPVCPKCGYPQVLRDGPHGEFWGCSTYHKTKCNGKVDPQSQVKTVAEVVKDEPLSLYEQMMAKTKPVAVTPKVYKPPVNPPIPIKAEIASFRIPADRISPRQKEAETVFTTMRTHLLMPSRAGGGKTTMLKHLASFRQAGQSMVYLAFNRKNAREGRRKLPREVPSMTTHSFCNRMLRDNNVQMPEEADQSKNWQIMEEVYPLLNKKNDTRKRIRRACFKLIGLAKNFAIRPGDKDGIRMVHDQYAFQLESEAEIGTVIDIVNEVLTLSVPGKKFGSIFDFDDMIWWPIVLDLKPTFFNVVLLDEVQDFNACQLEMVERMIKAGTRIIAVGDPYQAVYRFRGADNDAFDKLSAMLNGSAKGCETVLLPTNYRCGKRIIEWVVAHSIVKDIEAAPDAIDGEVREDLTYDDLIDMLAEEFGQPVA